MKVLVRRAVPVIGLLLIIYCLVMTVTANFNIGIVVIFLLGVMLSLFNTLRDRLKRSRHKWLVLLVKLVCLVLILGFLIILSLLIYNGNNDTAQFDENAVIVLGAGIKGETVSPLLKNRLDKAIEYWKKNPTSLILVSGGQGPQEEVSEAEAMKKYLLANNIPSDYILMEDKSTSTYENFVFSKKILDARFSEGFIATYITNDFHLYRAGKIADKAKVNHTSYSADTPWYLVPCVYVREVLSMLKFWSFGT